MKLNIFLPLLVLTFAVSERNFCYAKQLPLLRIITLPNVSGRLDHMAFDPKGNRLFVAALGNNTVEIIDVKSAKRTGTIAGLNSPQGVLYLEEKKCIVTSNAGDGKVQFFHSESFVCFSKLDLGDDADNMRYDSVKKQIYVGYGNGALGVVNAVSCKLITSIPLPGHPESFVFQSNGKLIFINIPSSGQVAVVDRVRKVQIATWKIKGMGDNFPMALDEKNHRLFIGFRSPAKLVILSSDSGKEIGALDCVGDIDDIFYDATSRCIYLSGGNDGIDVIRQTDADHYTFLNHTSTARGARTSMLDSDRKTLYVAVPRTLSRAAEIRAYSLLKSTTP